MADFLDIRSDRLSLQVVKPGSAAYGGARFNWNCFVSSILFDGKYRIAEPEQQIAGRITSRGAGLCSEYIQRCVQDETPEGEKWPHMGNGYLVRDKEPFGIFKPYAIEPFATTYETAENAVRFHTESDPCQGYAYREDKTVLVDGNRISIATLLENKGEKPILAQEYNHNFISINGEKVSGKYKLHLPRFDNVEQIREGGNLVGHEGYLTWSGAIPAGERFFNPLNQVKPTEDPCSWMLVHEDVPVTVREEDDFIPVRATVWGIEHCISTEVFVDIRLMPGQRMTWTRRWIFDTL
jgi:hypothetical protein